MLKFKIMEWWISSMFVCRRMKMKTAKKSRHTQKNRIKTGGEYRDHMNNIALWYWHARTAMTTTMTIKWTLKRATIVINQRYELLNKDKINENWTKTHNEQKPSRNWEESTRNYCECVFYIFVIIKDVESERRSVQITTDKKWKTYNKNQASWDPFKEYVLWPIKGKL